MMNFVGRSVLLAATFLVTPLFAQPKPSASNAQEFPVVMKQDVVAGKTPVGAKVEASLTLATLFSSKVIPEGATFSGEVIESVAKSGSAPSRLSIRMDSARWKKGTVAVKLYLTAWYYPIRLDLSDPDKGDSDDPMSAKNRHPYDLSGRRNPDVLPPIPSRSAEKGVLMKDVDVVHDPEGAATLTSSHVNLKLDKSTTYVFATTERTTPK
jgi:hypothetical protein